MSVLKNFKFKLSISDFQNSEHFIFKTSVKFNFRKFDRVGLRKNIADNVFALGEVGDFYSETSYKKLMFKCKEIFQMKYLAANFAKRLLATVFICIFAGIFVG